MIHDIDVSFNLFVIKYKDNQQVLGCQLYLHKCALFQTFNFDVSETLQVFSFNILPQRDIDIHKDMLIFTFYMLFIYDYVFTC